MHPESIRDNRFVSRVNTAGAYVEPIGLCGPETDGVTLFGNNERRGNDLPTLDVEINGMGISASQIPTALQQQSAAADIEATSTTSEKKSSTLQLAPDVTSTQGWQSSFGASPATNGAAESVESSIPRSTQQVSPTGRVGGSPSVEKAAVRSSRSALLIAALVFLLTALLAVVVILAVVLSKQRTMRG